MWERSVKTGMNSNRNYALDALKIAATILIVFHHYQQLTNSTFSDGINYFGGWFYFGMMVELFFLISGYLMHRYIPVIQEGKLSLKDWYLKRSSRLLPMVAVSVVVFEIALYVHGFLCPGGFCYSEKTIDVFGSIITTLGLQRIGIFDNPRINNPTWYISVLLLVYVVFYISTRLAKRLQCSYLHIYIFLVLLSCGLRKNGVDVPFFTNHTTRGYACFFYGLLLAEFVHQYGVSTKIAIADMAMLIVLSCLILFKKEFVDQGLWYLMSFVFFPGLVLLTETNFAKRLFRNRFWGIWGQISFNAYIWHCPMIWVMYSVTHFLKITPYYAQRKWMYVFCCLTMLVGVFSFYCIERPLNRFVQRKINEFGSQ